MAASIDINGKKLLPIKEAVSQVDYSRDYLTRLAREKKIVATQIGRMWYVDIDSVNNYQAVAQAEQEIKKRQLSDERKRELTFKEVKESRQRRAKKKVQRKTPAVATLCLLVALGVSIGVWLESHTRAGFASFTQLANLKTVALEEKSQQSADLNPYAEAAARQVVPQFTPNFTHRDLTSPEGLLLLPVHASGTTAVKEYFSDPVTVVERPDGSTAVQRLGDGGRPIGEEIPFVIVPVNTNSP